jgi:hypothetical protein
MPYNFASVTLTEFLPILATIAGMLLGFYGILKFVLGQAIKDRESDRIERKEFSLAIKEFSDSSRLVADATIRAADEAKQRNGHLAELTIAAENRIIDTVSNVSQQYVVQQTVENANVRDETIEHETVRKKD